MPGDYTPAWEKRDMAQLPMIPKKFIYVPTADKRKIFKELKDEALSGNYDYVITTCDPGREGQHIFWSFYDATGCKLPVKRGRWADLTVDDWKEEQSNYGRVDIGQDSCDSSVTFTQLTSWTIL